MESREVKEDRFKRLATKRTQEILKKLDILGHCANRHSYEYTNEEIQQIFHAIEKKLNDVKMKFKCHQEDGFKLQ